MMQAAPRYAQNEKTHAEAGGRLCERLFLVRCFVTYVREDIAN